MNSFTLVPSPATDRIGLVQKFLASFRTKSNGCPHYEHGSACHYTCNTRVFHPWTPLGDLLGCRRAHKIRVPIATEMSSPLSSHIDGAVVLVARRLSDPLCFDQTGCAPLLIN
jgi:hypothetical protein